MNQDKPLKLSNTLKSFNLPNFINKRSKQLNLNVIVDVTPVKRNWLERVLFTPERENIVVDFNSPQASLNSIPELQIKKKYCEGVVTLCDDIQNYMDGIKSKFI